MAGKKPGKLSVALIVLACIFAFLALTMTWVRNQTLDTNRYVATVAPLADNGAIQDALAGAVTKEIDKSVNPKTVIAPYLPAKAQPLAAPIGAALSAFAEQAVQRFFHSKAFPKVWEKISRVSHSQVVAVLEGKKTKYAELTTKGQVTLNVAPLVGPVRAAIEKAGLKLPAQPQESAGNLVILDAPALADAQGAVKALKGFTLLFQILAPVLFVAAVLASRARRRTVIAAGLSLAGTMVLLGVVLALGRWFYLDNLSETVPADASAAFFDTITRYFARAVRITALVGLLAAFAAWWSGGGKDAFADPTGARLASLVRVGVIALGSIILLVMPHPGAVAILSIVLLTALLALSAGPLVERREAQSGS